MIDIEVTLDKETADYVFGLNKNELRNALCVQVLRGRVQDETIEQLEDQIATMTVEHDHNIAENKAAIQVLIRQLKQAQAMLKAAGEAWLS